MKQRGFASILIILLIAAGAIGLIYLHMITANKFVVSTPVPKVSNVLVYDDNIGLYFEYPLLWRKDPSMNPGRVWRFEEGKDLNVEIWQDPEFDGDLEKYVNQKVINNPNPYTFNYFMQIKEWGNQAETKLQQTNYKNAYIQGVLVTNPTLFEVDGAETYNARLFLKKDHFIVVLNYWVRPSDATKNWKTSLATKKDDFTKIIDTVRFTSVGGSDKNITNYIKTFTSSSLGLNFKYVSFSNNEVYVKQVDNILFVTSSKENKSLDISKYSPTGNEDALIQVFTKTPTESLKDAVARQFLAGKPDYCTYEEFAHDKIHWGAVIIPKKYDKPSLFDPPLVDVSKCPQPYTADLGGQYYHDVYFISDDDYPNKFLFIDHSIQDTLGPGSQRWDSSITLQ